MPFRSQSRNRVLYAAKPGHSADPVSAVTKKGKTLLDVKHPIYQRLKWMVPNVNKFKC